MVQYRFDFEKDTSSKNSLLKEIIIWTIEIAVVIFIAFLLVNFAIEKTTIAGDSMNKTLKNGDKIIINKASYMIKGPKRFDVIVFKQTGKEHSYYNIKRVIGLPGERIQIKDGLVYVDDKPLEEPMPTVKITNGGIAEEEITLDEKEYFVLGDNRNDSEDSRFANIGPIISKDIIGKAWVKVKPLSFVSQLNKKQEKKGEK